MSKALQRLKRVLGPVLKVFAGNAGGQAVVVLTSLVVARLYSPEDFGLLTSLVAITALVAPLATLKVEHLVVAAITDREAVASATIGLMSSTGAAVLISLFSVTIGPIAFEAIGVSDLSGYWWLIGLTVLALGAVRITSSWMTRTEQFGRLGFRGLLQGLGQGVTQVALGFAGMTPVGLLLGIPAGRFLGLAGVLGKRGIYGGGGASLREIRSSAASNRRYILTGLPASALNSMGVQVPLLIFGALFGSAALGLLGFALRVLGAPIVSLGEAVAQVFESRLGKRVRSETDGREALLARTVLGLAILGLVPATIIFFWGGELFAVFFGEQWRTAGEISSVLAPAFLIQFAATPISRSLYLVSRVLWQLGWEIFRLVSVSGSIIIGNLLGLDFKSVVLCYSMSLIATYLSLILLSYIAARNSGNEISDVGRDKMRSGDEIEKELRRHEG